MSGLIDSIYENINDDYGYGKISDIKVVIRRKDGWINGSKLASLKKKKNGDSVPDALTTYKRVSRTQEIIEKITPESDSGVNLFEEITKTHLANQDLSRDNMNIIQGTYVPSLIGIDIAVWVSVDLYLKVLKVFEEYNNRENRILKILNGELETKNTNLTEQIEAMRRESNEKFDKVFSQNKETKEELKTTNEELKVVKNHIKDIYDLIKNDDPPDNECICIYNIPNTQGRYCIRAGLMKNIKNSIRKDRGTNVIFYTRISNSKRAFKEAKKLNIIPKQKESTFNLTDTEYNQITNTFKGIDDKYVESKKE